MGTVLFSFFQEPHDTKPSKEGVSSHDGNQYLMPYRRHCVDALLLTAYRMAQGPRQKGARAPDRLVLDLDTLRDSSTFASGQHTTYYYHLCYLPLWGRHGSKFIPNNQPATYLAKTIWRNKQTRPHTFRVQTLTHTA